jgi:hypothetical protein
VKWLGLLAIAACGGRQAPPVVKAPVVERPSREACETALTEAMKGKGGDFAALPEADREEMITDCQRDGAP